MQLQKYKIQNFYDMINHVVLFKLKEFPLNKKIEVLAELKSLLENLKNKIPEIKYLEVGVNYQIEATSYNIVLLSHFESIEDLKRYSKHPEHIKVVDRIKETTVSRAAVDYEF